MFLEGFGACDTLSEACAHRLLRLGSLATLVHCKAYNYRASHWPKINTRIDIISLAYPCFLTKITLDTLPQILKNYIFLNNKDKY
jgi:hypothetical protein